MTGVMTDATKIKNEFVSAGVHIRSRIWKRWRYIDNQAWVVTVRQNFGEQLLRAVFADVYCGWVKPPKRSAAALHFGMSGPMAMLLCSNWRCPDRLALLGVLGRFILDCLAGAGALGSIAEDKAMPTLPMSKMSKGAAAGELAAELASNCSGFGRQVLPPAADRVCLLHAAA